VGGLKRVPLCFTVTHLQLNSCTCADDKVMWRIVASWFGVLYWNVSRLSTALKVWAICVFDNADRTVLAH
jgi:hypothetical protein